MAGVLPPLPPPALAHVLTRPRVTTVRPGLDDTLDYVRRRVDAACAVVKGLPTLGWVDSSSVRANTKAVPLLSIAGVV